MHAIAVTRPIPPIHKKSVHVIPAHEFFFHFGHEIKVVRAISAGHPHLWRSPMPARFSQSIYRNPIWMRRLQIVISRMWIGADNHHHPQLAAASDQLAQHIAVAKPRAAVEKRNLYRIICDASAATQACRIGICPFEVIQPESNVEFSRIVLDQGQLCPTHGLVDPRGTRRNWWHLSNHWDSKFSQTCNCTRDDGLF